MILNHQVLLVIEIKACFKTKKRLMKDFIFNYLLERYQKLIVLKVNYLTNFLKLINHFVE